LPGRTARNGPRRADAAHALPAELQSYIGAALPENTRGVAPTEASQGTGIVVSVPATVDALVAAGQMSERFADRLGDRAVALPTLAARAGGWEIARVSLPGWGPRTAERRPSGGGAPRVRGKG
jgi:hypothetical protein